MKKILFSLLAIATLAACSKNDDDNNNNGGGNNGNGGTTSTTVTSTTQTPTVKKATTTHFENGVEHTSVIFFNYQNGRVTSMRSIYLIAGVQTGTVGISEKTYDMNGRITEVNNRNEDGSIDLDTKKIKYFYDANGNLERKEINYFGNQFTNKEVISYQYEGGKIKTTTSVKDSWEISNSIKKEYDHYEIKTYDFTPTSITVNHTTYKIYKKDSTRKDKSSVKTVYTLSNGNVVKLEETGGFWGTVTTLFEYDNTPKLESLLPITKTDPDDFSTSDFTKNNPTKEETTRVYTDFDNSVKTQKNTTRYEYEYNSTKTFPLKRKEFQKEEGKAETYIGLISIEY